jgi:hypothetical protein
MTQARVALVLLHQLQVHQLLMLVAVVVLVTDQTAARLAAQAAAALQMAVLTQLVITEPLERLIQVAVVEVVIHLKALMVLAHQAVQELS